MIAASAPSTSTPSATPGAGHSATKASTQYGAQRQPLGGATGAGPATSAAGLAGEFVIDRERGLLHGLQGIAREQPGHRSPKPRVPRAA